MVKKLIFAACVTLIVLASYWIYWESDQRLHVYFLNVGQGDAILIRTPDAKYVLIDGGPDKNVIDRELAEVMPPWITKIDLVVVTHADADHVTGLATALTKFEIDKVLINIDDHPTKIYAEVVALARQKDYQAVDANSDFVFGCCLKLDFLWPDPEIQIPANETNAQSISMIVTYLEFDIFLGGDLDSKYEDKLADLHDIELLKAGHHGSKTSTSDLFLDKLTPELSVISSGKNNKYGHPSNEALENLSERNIQILRTDTQGRVEVISDGINYWY